MKEYLIPHGKKAIVLRGPEDISVQYVDSVKDTPVSRCVKSSRGSPEPSHRDSTAHRRDQTGRQRRTERNFEKCGTPQIMHRAWSSVDSE